MGEKSERGRGLARAGLAASVALGDARVTSFAGARAASDPSAFFSACDESDLEMGVDRADARVPPLDAIRIFVGGLIHPGFTVAAADTSNGDATTHSNELVPQTGDVTAGGRARDEATACPSGERFEVRVDDSTPAEVGRARVRSFDGRRTEIDPSVFFDFFDDSDFERGVKVVDARVPPSDRSRVVVGGPTNLGFAVTVRDTLAGGAEVCSNELGELAKTVGDTDALPCV